MLAAPVLVVDDDADAREALRLTLESEGLAVMEASNGQEALDLLLSKGSVEPGLIVLDLRMPIMSGSELLAILTTHHQLARIPVLVVSGSLPHADLDAHGTVVGCLAKPFDLDQLLLKVRACLRRT